jgi:SRSO17 transposase
MQKSGVGCELLDGLREDGRQRIEHQPMAMTIAITGSKKKRRMASRNEAGRFGKKRAKRVGRFSIGQ